MPLEHFGGLCQTNCKMMVGVEAGFRIWMARPSMGLIPCLFALNKPLTVYTAIVASAARTLSRAPMC